MIAATMNRHLLLLALCQGFFLTNNVVFIAINGLVGFALETEDHRLRALAKLEKKHCDLMVLNGPEAMHSLDNSVEIMDREGRVLESLTGPKEAVAQGIFQVIETRLIKKGSGVNSPR